MKKNILGALVILFVTVALFLMMDDISKSKNPEPQINKVEVKDPDAQQDLATTDSEEES
ncbi:hypothetical protein [Winogradskyella sp. 3972H.M.0a.05]|uniref:hypothetical protein n=1 Tax=Winogradskyella sp. 3972H.M.0a.05 TaxID=2950277 RepID=UPI0033908E68